MEPNPAYEEIEAEFVALEERLADPELLTDRDAYAATARRYKELEVKAVRIRELRGHREDIETATEMLAEADAADRGLLETEIEAATAAADGLEAELADLMAPKDPNDGKNVIVEIKGAEGGEEANLFARDLFDMYSAFAGQQRWKLEMMNAQGSDMGGYTDVVFMLRGDDVWRKMKYEGGPHRVQRVPVTESQGRVHTSSATVSVLPVVGAGRPVGEHHRLSGPHHPQAHRAGGVNAGREEPASEPQQGNGRAEGPLAPGRTAAPPRRAF